MSSSLLICAKGHRWSSREPSANCPVCGEPGQSSLLPSSGGTGSGGETMPIEPSVMMSIDSPGVSAAFARHQQQQQQQVGSFTILGPHAQGGLGLVSLARDVMLQRDVALKQIRPQLADDPRSRHRFIKEAEITAQLEHPGIVPVHAMGHDGSGRPFYAMKFVRGRTLEQAIAEHHRHPAPRGLRDLLRRFVSICQAVAYAHSRGVIHRDLKPSNVMLGPFGETLILDWGLAKRIDVPGESGHAPSDTNPADLRARPAGSVTAAGQIVGTPLYMSPEQAAGDLSRQGPASDVYALGAILYQLLAGKPPFSGATDEQIVTALRELRPVPRPSFAKRGVNRALEAICLRAMAPRTEDRYGSAELLASEVDHWLADEPVAAYREPLPARLARLARRHRSVVMGAAAVIVVLALGVVATSVQMIRATRAERRAEREARVAQRRFDEVRELANRFMFDFDEKIAPLAGATPARQMLVQTSLDYLNKLAADAGDDPDLLRDLSVAYEKVGNIQGNYNLGNHLGDTAGALESYRKALDITRRLRAEGHASDPRDAALLLSRIGDVQEARGETAAALASYREVLEEFERAAAATAAPDRKLRRDLSVSYARVGDLLNRTGDPDGAMQAFEKSLEHARVLAEDESDRRAQFELTLPQQRIAQLLLARGDAAAALPHFRAAAEQVERLALEEPENARYQFLLEWAYVELSRAQAASGDVDAALAGFAQARDIAARLHALDPHNARPMQDLHQIDSYVGQLLLRADRPQQAVEATRRLLDTASAAAQANPRSSAATRFLGLAQQRLGQVYHGAGDKAAALEQFLGSLDTMRAASALDPQSRMLQRDVWVSHYNLGELYVELADDASRPLEDRVEQMRRALSHYRQAQGTLEAMGDGRLVEPGDETALDDVRKQIDACARWLESPTTAPATFPATTPS